MAPVSEQAIMHKVAWRPLPFLGVGYFINAARPHQRRDCCVDHEQVARLLTSFVIVRFMLAWQRPATSPA